MGLVLGGHTSMVPCESFRYNNTSSQCVQVLGGVICRCSAISWESSVLRPWGYTLGSSSHMGGFTRAGTSHAILSSGSGDQMPSTQWLSQTWVIYDNAIHDVERSLKRKPELYCINLLLLTSNIKQISHSSYF